MIKCRYIRQQQFGSARVGGRFCFQRPESGSQGFKIRCLLRDDKAGDILFKIFYHGMVQYLIGHHFAEPGRHLGAGNPLVGGMGAIRFAENRTAAGHMVGLLDGRPFCSLIQRYIHSAQLLEKKFTGARSAFITGNDIGDAAGTIQGIDHKCFATG